MFKNVKGTGCQKSDISDTSFKRCSLLLRIDGGFKGKAGRNVSCCHNLGERWWACFPSSKSLLFLLCYRYRPLTLGGRIGFCGVLFPAPYILPWIHFYGPNIKGIITNVPWSQDITTLRCNIHSKLGTSHTCRQIFEGQWMADLLLLHLTARTS